MNAWNAINFIWKYLAYSEKENTTGNAEQGQTTKSMLSEKMLLRLHKSVAPLCIALSIALFPLSLLYSAEERSYAREIKQYVAEDKVYLLENIQQNITRPSEKTVVEALLCESGPQAIELFQKQLKEYPDPALDQLSSSRITAYSLALDSTAPLPKLSSPLPSPKPQVTGVQESTKQHLASTPRKPKQELSTLPLPLAVTLKLEAAHPPSPAPVKPKQEVTHPASPAPAKPKQESIPPVSPAPVKPKQEVTPPASPAPVKPKQETTPPASPAPVKPKQESISPVSPAPVKPKQESISPVSPAPVKPKQEATPPASPAPVKPKQETAIARSTGYTLQFGLFAIKENAVALSKKISLYEPVEIIEHGKSYRVLLKKNYVTKQEAEATMKKLPFIAIIIPAREVQR
jgi:hypothetical protein